MSTACYLINHTPTQVLKGQAPFEVMNKRKPVLGYLRVFGCVGYVNVPGEMRNKLEAKSTKAMFIGYSTNQKGYRCYDTNTRRVLVSRDVKFLEERGYYADQDQEDLMDLSMDRVATLRIILEGLGIKGSQDPNRNGGTSVVPPGNSKASNTPHLDHEGGKVPESSNQDGESSAGGDEDSNLHNQDGVVHVQEEAREESGSSDSSPESMRQGGDEVGSMRQGGDDVGSSSRESVTHEVMEQVPVVPLRRSTRVRKDPSN